MLAWKRRRQKSGVSSDASPTVDGDPGVSALTGDAAPTGIDYESIVAGTVDDVVVFAEAHPEHVAALIDAERAGKNRKTLIARLEGIVDGLHDLADSSG